MEQQGFNISWIAAIILSVPLAIAGNLLTRFFERWMETRPQRKVSSKIKVLKLSIEKAEYAFERYGSPNEYLTQQIAFSLLITAFVASFASVLFGASQLVELTPMGLDRIDGRLLQFLSLTGTLVSAQGGLFAVQFLLRGTRVAQVMRTINEQKSELAELERQLLTQSATPDATPAN